MPKPAIIRFDAKARTEPLPDFTEADVEEGTRAQSGLTLFEDKSIRLKAGLWEAGASISPWLNYPADEFMMPLEGEIIIVEEGKETRAGPGESLVIPKGTRCRYRQDGAVRKFYVYAGGLADQAAPSGLSVIKLDTKAALAPSPRLPPTSCIRRFQRNTPMKILKARLVNSPSASGIPRAITASSSVSRATSSCFCWKAQ
jgi:uncharacterized cupin superfamily protein